jgi:hypothetical protein
VTPNQDSALARSAGGGKSLQQARGDELARGLSQSAQQRRDREGGHTAGEHGSVSDQVAEPATGYQAGGVYERIAADDEFERGGAGVQVALEGWSGHVDHEKIELGHEHGSQHHREHPPSAGVQLSGRRHGSRGGRS